MAHVKTTGVIGTPAAGMAAQGFGAGRAASGARGEELTAEILRGFSDQALIVHSLRLPVKLATDIDHLIVASDAVMGIDSKLWKPGYYHGWLGSPRRGVAAPDHLDSTSIADALDVLTSVLSGDRLSPAAESLIAVHGTKKRAKTRISTSLAWRPPPIVGADKLASCIDKFLIKYPGPADPKLAAAITRLHRKGQGHR